MSGFAFLTSQCPPGPYTRTRSNGRSTVVTHEYGAMFPDAGLADGRYERNRQRNQ
jgi:hypothetical protein